MRKIISFRAFSFGFIAFSILCFQVCAQNIDALIESAKNGDVNAQSRLGYIYRKGEGVDKNLELSFYWFSKAANQGDPVAQCNLAKFYDFGLGVKQDSAEAFKWHLSAAMQGQQNSQLSVAIMYGAGLGVNKDLVEGYAWFIICSLNKYDDGYYSKPSIALDLVRKKIREIGYLIGDTGITNANARSRDLLSAISGNRNRRLGSKDGSSLLVQHTAVQLRADS